jgi:hypothetical protein
MPRRGSSMLSLCLALRICLQDPHSRTVFCEEKRTAVPLLGPRSARAHDPCSQSIDYQAGRRGLNQRCTIVGYRLKKSIACCRDLIEASVALESRLSLRAAPDTMLL